MLPRLDNYDELYRQFRWQIPARYNIGVDVCDRWAEREPERVALDVTQGKVSLASAQADYGVVLHETRPGWFEPDAVETHLLREQLAASRGQAPFFDRGPGYRQLSGRPHADVDLL
jgi:hypothetical protein